MKTAKSAAKKTTKGAKATSTPKREKKAKVVAVPIEAIASESLPFDASPVETTAPEATAPVEATTSKPTKAKRRKPSGKSTKPAAKLGVLAAAQQVLAASATPMNCAELIEAMATQKLWSSPNGKTPAQTLYAAMIREISKKGAEARFIKTERGKFTTASKA